MKWYPLAALLLVASSSLWAQEPGIRTCLGVQEFCLSDSLFSLNDTLFSLCVEIDVDAGFPDSIDHFEIDWGDGSIITVVPGSTTPSSRTHQYDFSDFYKTCSEKIEYFIVLETYLEDENQPVLNNSFRATFKNLPVARFSKPDTLCVGQESCFVNTSCENADTASYQWIVDGLPISDTTELCHLFTTYGSHQVWLVATNECGSDTSKQIIWVRDTPTAVSGFSFLGTSGCVPDTVLLDDQSIDVNTASWQVLDPPLGWQFVESSAELPDTAIVLEGAGNFSLLHIAENQCGTDSSYLEIEAFSPPGVSITPPEEACGELLYQPNVDYSGSIDSVMWSLGDTSTWYDMYPDIELPAGIHTIRVVVTGPCGTETDSVIVVVHNVNGADSLLAEVLCHDSETVQLEVAPSGLGGFFECSTAVTADGIFDPSQAETGDNIICYNIPSALCPTVDTFIVTVQQGQDSVIVGQPEKICSDEIPYPLIFSPTGGEWLNSYVTGNPPDEVFSPPPPFDSSYNLTYRYPDPAGCITYKTKTLEVVTLPEVSGSDVSICNADTALNLVNLAALSVTPVVDEGILTCWVDGNLITDCEVNLSSLSISSHDLAFSYTIPPDCSTTENLALEITELQPVEAPPDTIICQNQPLILQGYPENCEDGWSPQPAISPSGEVITSAPFEEMAFTLTCSPGTVCETRDETVVTIKEGPTILLTEDWVCISQPTYTLPAGSPGGNWSGPALDGNSVVLADLPPGMDFTYTYTVETLPEDCKATGFTLHVLPLPAANFTLPETICAGTSVPFANNSMDATHYQWQSSSDGCNITPSTAFQPELNCQAGSYIITLEAQTVHPNSGEVLCTDTYSEEIHILAPPQQVAFAADETEGCAPLTVSFDNLSMGEEMQYFWDFGTLGGLAQDGPLSVTWDFPQETGVNENTIHTVVLTGWNQCGSLTYTREITVLPRPNAEMGIQFDEPCNGGELILNNLSTGSPLVHEWVISNLPFQDSATFDSLNPPPFTVFASDTPATVYITLTERNECGESVVSDSVLVLPSPYVARMSYSDERVCVGDDLLLANISTPGTTPRWEIVMSNNDTNSFDGDTLFFSPTVEGPFTVTLYANGNCGFDSETLEFEAMPLPVVSATYEPLIPCSGQPVRFEVSTEGNGMKLFYGDDDFTNLNISQHTYPDSGSYQLFAIAETPFGCKGEWRDTINIAKTPVAAIAFTDSICAGTDAIFEAEGSGAQSWEWHFCPGGCPMEGSSVIYTFPISGSHNVQLVSVSSLGCRDTTERAFFVRPTPVAELEIEAIKKCTPAEFVLHDRSSDATGIGWYLGDSLISTTAIAEAVVGISGEQSVTLIATNGNICFDTASTVVTVFASPALNSQQESGCFEAEGTTVLIETEEGNFVTLTGLDSEYDEPGNFHTGLPTGAYLAEAISPEGCKAELELFVSPIQELFIHLEQDYFEIDLGQEVQLEVSANQDKVDFLWAPAADLDDPTVPNPVARPLVSTFYSVAATNDEACVKYDTAFVRVIVDRDKGIFVPNTFTPNDDGANDIFRLRSANPGLAKIKSFLVFDRWGEKVYEGYDCQPETSACGWDGNFRGQKAEMGMYVWLAELEFLDSIVTNRKGTVMLVR